MGVNGILNEPYTLLEGLCDLRAMNFDGNLLLQMLHMNSVPKYLKMKLQ